VLAVKVPLLEGQQVAREQEDGTVVVLVSTTVPVVAVHLMFGCFKTL
jgi:hypothetical protein